MARCLSAPDVGAPLESMAVAPIAQKASPDTMAWECEEEHA